MNNASILLVDDEKDILQTLHFRLQAAGYKVKTAENGMEAMEAMRSDDFDLVLADFMMPEMNGIELTRAIKSHPLWFDKKVLLFSCNADPEFRRRAIEFGAVDYLPKTVGAGAILDRVYDLAPPQASAPEPVGVQRDHEMRRHIQSLCRSLSDMLHLAKATGELPEQGEFALDAARRIAEDIEKAVRGEADGRSSTPMPTSTSASAPTSSEDEA